MKPKIQIVIPCINLWSKYTKPCLDSIKSKHEHRIVLINNGSTDETCSEVGKLVSESFVHVHNDVSWSCAKSWNYGIKDGFYKGFDYVLVLNNDILLHPDAIDRMVERFEKKDADIVMVSCLDVRGECANPTDVFNLELENKLDTPESPHPNFSAFMINKECWDKIGEFDEKFVPCYFEDNDYHHRIELAGLKAICLPTAMFYHFGSRTQNEAIGANIPMCSSPQFEINRAYYKTKWGGIPGKETFLKPFNEI